ncbi:MAG: hypothetical protein AAGJ52_00270 [Pseudomonadota bacterium]
MSSPKLLILMLAWVTVAMVVGLLVTSHQLLLLTLIEQPFVPMGTPITAIGLIALAVGFQRLFSPLRGAPDVIDRRLGQLQSLSVWATLFWIPVGAVLSGNLSFSFSPESGFQGSDQASKLFWAFTYGLVLFPAMLWFVRGLVRVWLVFGSKPAGPE